MNTLTGRPLTKPRSAIVAFLFSLFIPGMGQVYNGQIKKAILFAAVILSIPLLFGITRLSTFYGGLVGYVAAEAVTRLYIIIDAVRNASMQHLYLPKAYNRWYYHLLICVLMLVLFRLYGTSVGWPVMGVKTYRQVAGSSLPTLQIGDRMLADTRAYKNKPVKRGDLVAFVGTDNDTWLYRVVAVPGDRLAVVNSSVVINDKPARLSFVQATAEGDIPVNEYVEELPGAEPYHIYLYGGTYPAGTDSMRHLENMTIPAGKYFLLGDNRDNAYDSRYIGLVDEKDIIGKILFKYGLPWDKWLKEMSE